jgi:hypothetical protein
VHCWHQSVNLCKSTLGRQKWADVYVKCAGARILAAKIIGHKNILGSRKNVPSAAHKDVPSSRVLSPYQR